MSSREAFEKWWHEHSGGLHGPEKDFAWESWKVATERAAVLAWGVGMIHYKGSFQDSREVGSKCASAIREGNE